MKILRKILLITSLIIACLFAALVAISLVYQEKIAHYAINELNKHIRTSISVRKITFSLLRKFPDATIRFRDIYIKSVPDFEQNQFINISTDTLLCAKDLFIQMNLIKLLKKQYILKEVHVHDGILNIFNDQDGSGNFTIWKPRLSDDTTAFRIEMQHLEASDIYLQNLNLAKKIIFRSKINKLVLNGDLSTKEYKLDFFLDGDIINYISNGFTYLFNKKVSIRSGIHVIDKNFQVLNCDLFVEQLQFSVEGFANRDKELFMDLNISGKDLDIASLIKNFPLLTPLKVLSKFRTSGIFNFEAQVSGLYTSTVMPEVKADFSVLNGSFYHDRVGRKYEKIKLSGKFTNGSQHSARTTEIIIGEINIESGNSRLGGYIHVKDLVKPEIQYQIKADMNLIDILPYFNTEKLEYYHGSLIIQMDIKGFQDNPFRIKKDDLMKWQYKGMVTSENIQFKMVDNPMIFDRINGTIIFQDYLFLNDLSLIISGNNLIVSGRADNFFEYVFTENGNLWLDIDVYSPDLLLDSLIMKDLQANRDTIEDVSPGRIYLKSRFWFDHFHYKNFEAENIQGDVVYKPGWILFNSIDFSAMGGNLKSNGFIEQEDQLGYMVRITTNVNNLDITRLFQSFNNFGQLFIQDKHLKGKLSGEVDFYSGFDQQFRIMKETLLAESDVEIENGELINFEPMLGLSKFIEVEELEHIKFSTLKNRIFIRQSEVIIPQMDIYSSAINVSGSGEHGFNNFFTYKINLDLSDILLKKPRKNELKFEEHVIQDDGLGRTKIFLTIEGTPDNYKINYDRKGAVQFLKDKLDGEKLELKEILKEEFGIFRDDTIQEKQKDFNKTDFIFEWEDSAVNDTGTFNNNKSGKQRFFIEWEDE